MPLRVVDRYEQATKDGGKQQYYVSESFRVYYKDGVRTRATCFQAISMRWTKIQRSRFLPKVALTPMNGIRFAL